jgi:hypothetical protein
MSQDHNVFISWSGERSLTVAKKLREWLPLVVQASKPWMSEADIEKGSRGLNELAKALNATTVGIVCLTPENLETAWVLFEAGALSKAIDDSNRLCTFLLDGLKPEDVKPPLGMFQATRATKEETRKLVRTVNSSVSANPVREDDLNELFDAMWPSLENTILSLPALEPVRKVKRDPNEMIAEILELVRAEANRRTGEVKRPLPMVGISPTQVRAIVERVQSIQKFIGELLEHASHWSFADGVVTIYFPQAKSTFAGLMEGRDTKAKVRSCASDVLGSRVEINVAIDD